MPARSLILPRSLHWVLWILYGGAVTSVAYTFFQYERHGLVGWTPLYMSMPRFDFWDYIDRFTQRHSARFFTLPGYPWYYPAPALFGHYPFYKVALAHGVDTGYNCYIVFTILACACAAWIFARSLHRAGLGWDRAAGFSFGVALCSWPVYFAVQRGNIEAFTWLILAAGVWAFTSKRPVFAAVFIGLAGSMKIYPLLFIALFLRRLQWRPALVAIAVFLLCTVLSLRYLDPNIGESLDLTIKGIQRWTTDYSQSYAGVTWDHSIFGLLKDCLPQTTNLLPLLSRYYVIAAVLALLLFLRVYRLPEVNLVLFIGCAAITLPPTSFDYTLSMLYIPFAWLAVIAVRSSRLGVPVRGLGFVLGLLAVSLAPQAFLWSSSHEALPGAFKAICLLCVLVSSTIFPLCLPVIDPQPRTA